MFPLSARWGQLPFSPNASHPSSWGTSGTKETQGSEPSNGIKQGHLKSWTSGNFAASWRYINQVGELQTKSLSYLHLLQYDCIWLQQAFLTKSWSWHPNLPRPWLATYLCLPFLLCDKEPRFAPFRNYFLGAISPQILWTTLSIIYSSYGGNFAALCWRTRPKTYIPKTALKEALGTSALFPMETPQPWISALRIFRGTSRCFFHALEADGRAIQRISRSLLSRKKLKSAGLSNLFGYFFSGEICLANIRWKHRIFTSKFCSPLFQMRFPTRKRHNGNGLLDASQCPSHSWRFFSLLKRLTRRRVPLLFRWSAPARHPPVSAPQMVSTTGVFLGSLTLLQANSQKNGPRIIKHHHTQHSGCLKLWTV